MKIAKRFSRLIVALCTVLLMSTGLLGASNDDVLNECRSLIRENYYKAVPEAVLQKDTIQEMIAGLNDPYTKYMTKEQVDAFYDSIELEGGGYGVDVFMDKGEDVATVYYVMEKSPADKAGIKIGDKLVAINGIKIGKPGYLSVSAVLSAPVGEKYSFTFDRDGNLYTKTMTSVIMQYPAVSFDIIDGHIIYIRLSSFSIDSADLVLDALQKGVNMGGDSVILDLRNNLGGYTHPASYIASFFSSSENVMQWVENGKTILIESYCKPVGLPSIVLTNGYSASSSELVAAAIKDGNMGLVVGTNTYGKGVIQTSYELSNGDVLHLTIAEFRSPDGNVIHGLGVAPDYQIVTVDGQMDKAIKLLSADEYPAYVFTKFSYRVGIGVMSDSMECYPIIADGSFMVPARVVADILNCNFAVSNIGQYIYTDKKTGECIYIEKDSKYPQGFYVDVQKGKYVGMVPAKILFNRLGYDIVFNSQIKSIEVINK